MKTHGKLYKRLINLTKADAEFTVGLVLVRQRIEHGEIC